MWYEAQQTTIHPDWQRHHAGHVDSPHKVRALPASIRYMGFPRRHTIVLAVWYLLVPRLTIVQLAWRVELKGNSSVAIPD